MRDIYTSSRVGGIIMNNTTPKQSWVYEDDSLGPVGGSRKLVAKVGDLGLQPYETPDPRPQLEEKDEVKLVCWMVVTPKQDKVERDGRPSLISQSIL
ncbi:hypothetical protein [Halomicrobium salinisoli]|uniref:hypothetical protein n=1 Tax=Halomicrobium salinisoli TaxID=2878391 RepID=UPI001CF0997E|nr:hypothetical protein [Halomicrobium salinisoli]